MNADKARHLLLNDDDNDDLDASGNDTCDDDEFDALEVRDNDYENEEEKEIEEDDQENPDCFKTPNQPSEIPVIRRSETVEMINSEETILHSQLLNVYNSATTFNDISPASCIGLILGRQKKSNVVFSWFPKPNRVYPPTTMIKTRVFQQIINQNSIEYFFKLIISPEMVQEIVDNTNRRIQLIDNSYIHNENYRQQRNQLMKYEINSSEIYAFIGLLILFGITKKSHVPIEEIWSSDSIHYASFAAATLSRERFQLIAKNLTFDNISNYYIAISIH